MKMGSGRHVPTSFCFSSSDGFSRWVLRSFPSSPSALPQRPSAKRTVGTSPCPRSPGQVLSGLQGLQIFQCYVVAEMILLLFGERREEVMIPSKLFPKAIPSQSKRSSVSPQEKPGRGPMAQTPVSPLAGGCVPCWSPMTALLRQEPGETPLSAEQGMSHPSDPRAPNSPQLGGVRHLRLP